MDCPEVQVECTSNNSVYVCDVWYFSLRSFKFLVWLEARGEISAFKVIISTKFK